MTQIQLRSYKAGEITSDFGFLVQMVLNVFEYAGSLCRPRNGKVDRAEMSYEIKSFSSVCVWGRERLLQNETPTVVETTKMAAMSALAGVYILMSVI